MLLSQFQTCEQIMFCNYFRANIFHKYHTIGWILTGEENLTHQSWHIWDIVMEANYHMALVFNKRHLEVLPNSKICLYSTKVYD